MKKKIIKLTESDLQRIVEKVINEDFVTRLIARGKGLISALKSRSAGEGRDVRQVIKAIERLKSTASQSNPLIIDLKKDLDLLFKESFMQKVTKYKTNVSNQNIEPVISEFQNMLNEYRTAVQKVIDLNTNIQKLDLTDSAQNTTTKPTNDKPAV